MEFLIVENDDIQNIIIADEEFAESIGAKPFYEGARIGEPYNPPPDYNKLRADALQRIDGHCSATIESGVVVDSKRYILSKYDGQNSLQNALVKAEKGENPIPFSAYGENKPSPYTPEQIKAIAKEADNWGTVNITYYGYLKDWIARETDVDILNGIEYGSTLPDDLMQELATKLSQFGIDITKYSALLGGGAE